jgi:hypothetical protein
MRGRQENKDITALKSKVAKQAETIKFLLLRNENLRALLKECKEKQRG